MNQLTHTHTHLFSYTHASRCQQQQLVFTNSSIISPQICKLLFYFFFANGIFSKLADHSEIMKTHLLFGVFSTFARWNRYFSDINVICANANLHFTKIFAYYFLYFTSSISIYANIRFFVCVSNYLLDLRNFVFQQILTPKVFSSFLY